MILFTQITFVWQIAVSLCLLVNTTTEGDYLCEQAKPSTRPLGAPHYSDVCFSSRSKHPSNPDDPHNTFRDAAAFHATRLDWVYSDDMDWVAEIDRRGYALTLAQHAATFADWRKKGNLRGHIQDKNGDPVALSFQVKWERWTACVNNPDYRERLLREKKAHLDAGVNGFQFDDWGFGYQLLDQGACHCQYCAALAAEMKLDLNDKKQMETLQRQSLWDFYTWLTSSLDEYAGHHVPFSCNWYPGNQYQGGKYEPFFRKFFDYGIGEARYKNYGPRGLHKVVEKSREINSAQIFTHNTSDGPEILRNVASLCYAMGAHMIVPWDVYQHGKPYRYFGKPEEYADLFGFVRGIADYLDGYEEVGAHMTEEDTASQKHSKVTNPSFSIQGNSNLLGFARAKPGNRMAPVVIHLVQWGKTPQSESRVELNTDHFFGGKPLSVHLLTPAAYDKEQHAGAEEQAEALRKAGEQRGAAQAGAYASLVSARPLETRVEANSTFVAVPPLHPWGILVVEPVNQ